MSYMPQWRSSIGALAAAIIAASLAACGGGGSDSPGPASVTPAASTPPATGTGTGGGTGGLAVDATAPVATNDIAVDGRNWINYRRTQAGVPVVAVNAQINNAALGHSEYLRTNNVMSHDQVAGRPGFTGATLRDRLNAAGYTVPQNGYAYGEVISGTTNGNGFFMAEELITAIYHRFVMFEPKFREIGTGAGTSASRYSYFTADFATRGGFGPGIGATALVTWPFSGQTSVTRNFMSDSEEPDPVAGLNEVGYPVSVHANIDARVTMQAFTLRPRGGASLQVQVVYPSGERTAVAIVPLAPLKAGTTYEASFSGTVNGAPVTRDWSFTTR